MAKQLIYNEDARKKMLSGVEQIAQAVKVTLGPCGRLVMLDKKYGAPTITKDGVSVAKEVELKDPFENTPVSSSDDFLFQESKKRTADGTDRYVATIDAYKGDFYCSGNELF